jgi:hypothetical protein
VAARISRLGINVSKWNMTERLLEDSDERTVVAGLRYHNVDPGFPFVAVRTTVRVNDAESADAQAAQVAEAYRGVGVRGFTFWEQPGRHPSLRTAQKLGRRPVQQEYFVSLSAP